MQEIVGAIPDFAFILFILVTAAIILITFYTHYEIRNTPLSAVGWGLDTWAVTHEGLEIAYVFFLMVMSPLFYSTFQIFARGVCAIGPVIALIGAAYIYAKKTGTDFEDMTIGILIGFGFLVVMINAIWASLPSLALALAFYTPVIASFSIAGWLLHRSGVHRNWLAGLISLGFGHELGEAVLFHRIGIRLLRGADPAVPKSLFLLFLALQIAGPIILYLQSRRE